MPDLWLHVDLAVTVPVNILPLLDDVDFKSRETGIVFNQAGLDLVWNFVTSAGVQTQTAVTPTEAAGNYDWTSVGDGMYNIEIPASGGASINNDTEGFGWFTGVATGVLPWRGPIIGFRAAGLNNLLIDTAFSATRGLAGTALPAAAADAAGGLPISDAGGLDLDAQVKTAIDVIAVDVAGLDGAAMRGTDSAALASVATELRLAELDAGNLPTDVANVKVDTAAILVDTGTTLDGRIPAALVGGRMDSDVGAKTGNVALSAQEKLDVNAEADTALADYDAPTNAEMVARTLAAASYATATGVSAVETDTQDIQGRLPAALVGGRMDSDVGAKSGNVALSAQEKLDVNAELDTSLADARVNELVGATAGGVAPIAGSIMDSVMNKDAGQTFDRSTDSLEALKDGASAPTAAAIADAVLDEPGEEHQTPGSAGAMLKSAANRVRKV